MPPSTSSCLRQGPTHVMDTGRCPTPCPNPTEVVRLGQLFLCCSRLDTSPSSQACSVLFPALRLSCAAVCAATKFLVHCSQDLSDLRTTSVLCPNWRGELVVTACHISKPIFFNHRCYSSHCLVRFCTALADSQTLYKGVGKAVDTHLLCPAWPTISQLCISTGKLMNW